MAFDEAALVSIVKEELARRRISRQRLADDAGISLSTLEKALNGGRAFTLATVVRLEQALGRPLRPVPEPAPRDVAASGFASVELGAYAPAAVRWLEGDYLTLRPSFEAEGAIYAYLTTIAWDAAQSCLAFRESQRLDAPFSQKGVISMPNKSGQIYLHTNEDGQLRLAILGRPRIGGEMYGLLTTLQAGAGGQLLPVSAPLALIPLRGGDPVVGRVTAEAPAHARYREHLATIVSGGFARLIAV